MERIDHAAPALDRRRLPAAGAFAPRPSKSYNQRQRRTRDERPRNWRRVACRIGWVNVDAFMAGNLRQPRAV
ncbi:MAG: hypothetical protein R3F11_29115 [Verrucomicrobiales bacterium]